MSTVASPGTGHGENRTVDSHPTAELQLQSWGQGDALLRDAGRAAHGARSGIWERPQPAAGHEWQGGHDRHHSGHQHGDHHRRRVATCTISIPAGTAVAGLAVPSAGASSSTAPHGTTTGDQPGVRLPGPGRRWPPCSRTAHLLRRHGGGARGAAAPVPSGAADRRPDGLGLPPPAS